MASATSAALLTALTRNKQVSQGLASATCLAVRPSSWRAIAARAPEAWRRNGRDIIALAYQVQVQCVPLSRISGRSCWSSTGGHLPMHLPLSHPSVVSDP